MFACLQRLFSLLTVLHFSTIEVHIQVNVLISEDGVAVLADFGLTKAAQSSPNQPVDLSGVGQSTYRSTRSVTDFPATCVSKLLSEAYCAGMHWHRACLCALVHRIQRNLSQVMEIWLSVKQDNSYDLILYKRTHHKRVTLQVNWFIWHSRLSYKMHFVFSWPFYCLS